MVDIATLAKAVGFTAPFYNLVLVIITIILFLVLLEIRTKLYHKPWKLIFVGVLIATLETVMTIMRNLGLISFHPATFVLFEMIIISLFIYAMLLQRQYISTGKKE